MTPYLDYGIYLIAAVSFFLLARRIGFEYYLVIPFLIVAVSPTIWGRWFLIGGLDVTVLNVHPLTFLWFVVFCLETLTSAFAGRRLRLDLVRVLAILVLSTFFAITLWVRGTRGMAMFAENYFGPITFFLLFYTRREAIVVERIERIVRFFLGVALCVGVFGIYEYLAQSNRFDANYSDFAWYPSIAAGYYRIRTVVGHPIVNSVFFLMIVVMVGRYVRPPVIRSLLFGFFLFVIVLTGTRTAIVLGILYVAIAMLSHTARVRNVVYSGLAVGLVVFAAFRSQFGETLLNRLQSESGSSMARLYTAQVLLENLGSFQMRGLGGMYGDVYVQGESGNTLTPENPWVILFFDASYFVVLYLFFVVVVWKRSNDKAGVLILLVSLTAFNSFGVKSTVNYFLYLIAALGCTQVAHSVGSNGGLSERLRRADRTCERSDELTK